MQKLGKGQVWTSLSHCILVQVDINLFCFSVNDSYSFFFYEGNFSVLLRELVAEFTLTDNSSNTTTSLLRSLCHYDDSVLLGSWLQETDHKSIEDQARLLILVVLFYSSVIYL